jgi:hypothetical protein
MDIVLYVTIPIIIVGTLYFLLESGWVHLWNSIFVGIMLFVLVYTQKHIGKLEGAVISLVPFIFARILIERNRKVGIFYIAKQRKFVNFFNKYIYDLEEKKIIKKKRNRKKKKKK